MLHQFKVTFLLVLYFGLFLESHAVSQICSLCDCRWSETYIYCTSLNLTSVPKHFPSSIEYLNLGSNNLKQIKADSFLNLSSLTTLYLHNNEISEIEIGSFQGLSSLTELYLHNNEISEIEIGSFQGLSSLTELNLHANKIKNIEAETFQNMSKLSELDLSYNSIQNIKPGVFQNMSELIYLNLGFNNMTDVNGETFKDLPGLRKLYLYGNGIKEIEAKTFQMLSGLTYLNLVDNNITMIEGGSFQYLASLTTLYLSHNDIKEIKPKTFENMPSLKYLYLDNNTIIEINIESFENLTKLTNLYLKYNKIRDIEAGSFQTLSSLSRLDLSGNALKEIKSNTFQNIQRLTHLNLNENHLGKIEVGALKDLPSLGFLYLKKNKIKKIEVGAFDHVSSLRYLYLQSNDIKDIERETFRYLSSLSTLDLSGNGIEEIEAGIFRDLSSLKYLYLGDNDIKEIESRVFRHLFSLSSVTLNNNYIKELKSETFQNLTSLRSIYLRNNRIQKYEDGVFLFLPNINYIDLGGNKEMMCGCHLPAWVNYTQTTLKRSVYVQGECQMDLGNNQSKVISILEYAPCQNYALFQRNLQCETCSRMMCNASEVTSCPEAEPVCRLKLSMKGVTLTPEKSCTTYKECFEGMRNNSFTCKKWTNGTSCVACCTGNLCNKNDFTGWSNSFVFHLVIFNLTLKYKEYNTTAETISRTLERDLSKWTGMFEVDYCGFEKNSEVFSVTSTVPRRFTKDQVFEQIFETFNTSQTLRDLGFQDRNMELFGEGFCQESTSTSNGTFHWPVTKIGTNVTIPCHANVATRYCSSRQAEPSETRRCSPFTGIWQEASMSQCYNTDGITQRLKNITSEAINEENVEEVSTILRNITKESVYFKPEHIDLAVDIHEKMVPLISNVSANVTVNNILISIEYLINTPEEVLVEAEQSEKIASRMLDIIEAIPEKIPLEEQQLAVINSNLGIGVIKVENGTFNGASYGVSFGNKENKAKTMIYNRSNSDPQANDMMDFISLPNSLLKHMKTEKRLAVSRISFFSMTTDKLYRVTQYSRGKTYTNVSSNIIAANVPNIKITNLSEPVTLAFNLMDQNLDNPQCGYWDESSEANPYWSTEGCNTSKYVAGEKIFCSCNHLTSFAILDVYQETSHLLSITSYIGCGIALACLILTIIIHVCSKNLRKLTSSRILINLCISLAITNIIFLVGMHSYALEGAAGCKTVAALLHYFLLTSLMWMAVEAFHLFHSMAYFMVKSSIMAWGLPAVIVAITLGINNTKNYIRIAQVCWLSKTPFYAAFLAPVVVILLFTFTMSFIVIRRLISTKIDKLFEHETKKMRIFGIFGCIFLFALSWIIAFIALEEEDEVFQILFIIFNILLGMFIFTFYCICKKDARDAICVCKQKKETIKPTFEKH